MSVLTLFLFYSPLPPLVLYENNHSRYKILASQGAANVDDEKKVAQIILDAISLEKEQYRLGNTKANSFILYADVILLSTFRLRLDFLCGCKWHDFLQLRLSLLFSFSPNFRVTVSVYVHMYNLCIVHTIVANESILLL